MSFIVYLLCLTFFTVTSLLALRTYGGYEIEATSKASSFGKGNLGSLDGVPSFTENTLSFVKYSLSTLP